MAKSERDFQHESLQDNRTIVAYLRALQEGFEKGTLTLGDQDGEIVLSPDGLVRFELEANRKRNRVRMTMKFEWKEGESDRSNKKGTLRINGELK